MPSNPNKRLLLFAYFYPPLGGPAVQRPCKTVKYLTQLGWEVDVITIKEIVYHSTDDSLLSECAHKKIFRTASLDPMYFLNKVQKLFNLNAERLYFKTSTRGKSLVKRLFLIDEKIGWLPFAYQAGMHAILSNRYRAVMVTCNPFSSALAAKYIAKKANLPLILDYRDHWTLNNNIDQPCGTVFKIVQSLERHLLNSAALILTATSVMKQDLVTKFGQHLSNTIIPFFNGWDEADFIGKSRGRIPDGIIRIAYLGTLYGDKPLKYFFEALKQGHFDNSATDFEFQMVGNFYSDTLSEVEASGITDHIALIGQQQHAKAIRIMLESDILLLVIGDEMNKWVLTGKLFEYLRCQKPILTLAPKECEAADILRSCGHTAICDIRNTEEIKQNLFALFDRVKTGVFNYKIPYEYERSKQVEMLSERISCL
jgi:glycosyltransferase involved in cell wall biosynthesis